MQIRDITASMMNEILNDVKIEPRLQPITGEQMRYRTATSGDATMLDFKARDSGGETEQHSLI